MWNRLKTWWAWVVDKLWAVTPTPAGFLKSKYPDGNDSAAPPVWSAIPDFVQKSAAFSVDVTPYLTGGYDTLSLIVVSGTLSGSGWSLAAPILSYSGTGTGRLTIRIAASLGSQVANSNLFLIESIALPTVDTTKPTTPVSIGLTLNAANQPVLTWKAAMDPAPAGAVWAGIKDYPITRNGAALATIAGNPGLQLSFQRSVLGAPAVAGSTTQDAATALISMSAGGINYFDTTDDGEFFGAPVTGDFWASVKVTSFTCANPGAKVMIDARASTTANAAHVAGSLFPYASGRGFNLYYRTAQGGPTVKNAVTASTASPLWLALQRIGALFNFLTSADGVTFALHSSVTASLPTTVQLGIAGCAQLAATSLSASFDQWSVTQEADYTYTDTTAGTGTLESYTVGARDLSLNAAAVSPAISITPPIPGGGNPGGGGVGNYIISEGWEGGLVLPATVFINPGYGTTPASRRAVQSVIRRGGQYAMRQHTESTFTDHPERTELRFLPDLFHGVESWIGFSCYLENWDLEIQQATASAHNSSVWDYFWQDHDTAAWNVTVNGVINNRGLNPPMSLGTTTYADGIAYLSFLVRGDRRTLAEITTVNGVPFSNGASYESSRTYKIAPVVSNIWTDWCLHFKLSSIANPDDAFVDVYRNGVLQFHDVGINTYTNVTDANGIVQNFDYWKCGIYKGFSPVSPVTQRTVYHDEIRWGRVADGIGFAEVYPANFAGPLP